MTALLVVTCVVTALFLGVIVGWTVKRGTRWCRQCGGYLTCASPVCEPVAREVARSGYRVVGRAPVPVPTDPRPLMPPLADRRTRIPQHAGPVRRVPAAVLTDRRLPG